MRFFGPQPCLTCGRPAYIKMIRLLCGKDAILMKDMEEKFQEYAQLLIDIGLNVQKGQTLVISSPVECA